MSPLTRGARSPQRRHLSRRSVVSHGTVAVVLAGAIVASLAVLLLMSNEQRYVAAPAIACTLLMLYVTCALWARDGVVPLFDVGFFCVLATFAYSVYPLLNYWQNGMEFSYADLSDTRLSAYAPSPREMGVFHVRHVLYLSSLVLAYLAFRGRGAVTTTTVTRPPVQVECAAMVLFAILTVFFMVLRGMTGIAFKTSYAAADFEQHVAVLSRTPLWLLQISGKLAGLLFVIKLSLLYSVVSRCRRTKWLVVLGLWIAVEVASAIALKGGRAAMILFLMATALLYQRLVRPLSFKTLAFIGGAMFALFMFLGLYRSFENLATLKFEMRQTQAGLLGGNNEFQALLGTAYDVAQRKAAGVELPWYLYINDIIDVLPPQQLLPFQKVTASEWYLRELGLSGTGQGYMWGVITQAIVGLDRIELALRGFILGTLLAWFHRWYRRRQTGFVETYVYVYLCIHVFYTFRNTTLSILANIVWELIPFFVIVVVSVTLMSRSRQKERPLIEMPAAPTP